MFQKSRMLHSSTFTLYFNTFFNKNELKISEFDDLISPSLKKKLDELDFYIDKYSSIHSILENNGLLGFQKQIKQME